MRWDELVGLRRENIDLDACEIRIVETIAEPDRGSLRPERPKSRAGLRIISFPDEPVPELHWHLERFALPGPQGLVFVGPKGAAALVQFPADLECGHGHSRSAGSAFP